MKRAMAEAVVDDVLDGKKRPAENVTLAEFMRMLLGEARERDKRQRYGYSDESLEAMDELCATLED